MSDSVSHCDQDYYQTLVNRFVDEFPWVFVEDAEGIKQAVAQAAAAPPAVGELCLVHIYTDARIYLRFPEYRNEKTAQVVLLQPLDCALASAEEQEGFTGFLTRSHAMIAGIYQSEYIQPQTTPEVILRGYVPLDYSKSKFDSMLTAIDATALRIQRLHDDIRAPISEVLAEQDTMPPDR